MRLQRAISVFLAGVALFPVISASDDRLVLADSSTAPVPQSASLDRGQIHNAASPPLEDPEHGQTSAPFLLLAPLVSVFVVAPSKTPLLLRWFAGRSLGRAPPSSPARA
jgi:hypothetical protein